MKRKTELSCEVRAQIAALHNEGLSCWDIASRLKCHHTTVVLTIKRHSKQENFESRFRSGRLSAFTPRLTRTVKCLVAEDPRLTSAGMWMKPSDAKVLRGGILTSDEVQTPPKGAFCNHGGTATNLVMSNPGTFSQCSLFPQSQKGRLRKTRPV